MNQNKHIERRGKVTTKIFDNRSLEVDYRTLQSILQPGMSVLDVGCGTGAIAKDIAKIVGPKGTVLGIDNTSKFIESGKSTYKDVHNLALKHVDLFDFKPDLTFDLIIASRMLQWLNNPKEALLKMKSLLNENGIVSILDYNHNTIEWVPEIPNSMRSFYTTFLKWRSDAGMNNGIADDLPELLKAAGFHSIEKNNSDEYYDKSRSDYKTRIGIWSKVAGSKQMVDEGYLDDALRLKAIEEYDQWVAHKAISMTMKLNEVRGKI